MTARRTRPGELGLIPSYFISREWCQLAIKFEIVISLAMILIHFTL